MELKDSRTAKNLLKAFAGESQARNRYTFAASVARDEGLEHVAAVFLETADNEKEHAKLFFRHLAPLAPAALEITASYPVVAGDAAPQLKAAFEGENEEWSDLYPEFARVAKEEGFADIARTFTLIARVEKAHEVAIAASTITSSAERCPARRKDLLALPQLRLHPRRRHGPRPLPRLPAPASVLRAGRGEVLRPRGASFSRAQEKGPVKPAE